MKTGKETEILLTYMLNIWSAAEAATIFNGPNDSWERSKGEFVWNRWLASNGETSRYLALGVFLYEIPAKVVQKIVERAVSCPQIALWIKPEELENDD